MKTDKTKEESEVTPSKKKLKQARLPFKLISDVSPAPVTPLARKRKLSASEAESATKVGKISKENDLVDDLVVISDDDSKDGQQPQNEDKPMNPYVKLVDAAWKKKLQKSKSAKKIKYSKNKTDNSSLENESANDTGEEKTSEDCETMDVDEPNLEAKSDKTACETDKDHNTLMNNDLHIDNDIIIVDGSNTPDVLSSKSNDSNDNLEPEVIINTNEISKSNTPIESPMISKESESRIFPVTDSVQDEYPKSLMKNNSGPDHSEILNKYPEQTNLSSNSNLNTEKKLAEAIYSEEITVESLEKNDSKVNLETASLKSPLTPKRSARNKAKAEQIIKPKSPSSGSKVNESISSPTTPKHTRSSSVTNSQGDDSLNESLTGVKNLTPKQLQKKLESAKKKEEREKEKEEREKKRQQEKEERVRQRQEKEDQRKREKEEKEEQKRKEKEEKDRQKEMEKKQRDEKEEQKKKEKEEKEEQRKREKEEKEEQRKKEKEAREDEKRKKQEAVELEKQEQELKKKKAAEAFVNFFVPKQKSEKDQTTIGPISRNNMLSSFTIKTDMRLAPIVRVELTEERAQQLHNLLINQNAEEKQLYLKCLKNGTSKPQTCGKTWPMSDKDEDDVMIIEDELPLDGAGELITCDALPREKLRPKLLSFHENRRPPYWGTWRKHSAFVKPRKPFGQDGKQLDYEVDSDEDWEEEQEGESIDGSAAGSDDEQDADEYEVDNEVFVPHGYLSDEEATMDDDDVLSLSPETQKARLKHLEDEFEFEMKKPTEKLKPRMYGLLWETIDGGKPEKCVDALWNYFGKLSMIMNDPTPLLQPLNEPEESEKKKVKKKKVVNDGEQKSPRAEKKKKTKLEDKEGKPPKTDTKKSVPEKKNQPGINMFLTKLKSA